MALTETRTHQNRTSNRHTETEQPWFQSPSVRSCYNYLRSGCVLLVWFLKWVNQGFRKIFGWIKWHSICATLPHSDMSWCRGGWPFSMLIIAKDDPADLGVYGNNKFYSANLDVRFSTRESYQWAMSYKFKYSTVWQLRTLLGSSSSHITHKGAL